MEIREFAEQILFGTTLEDKLAGPDRAAALTDHARGPSTGAVALPGRPSSLDLAVRRPKVPFPSLGELDDPTRRGHVLHFFANHELLAMELMALALLRFPEAPASFRKGLVVTILEERAHLRLYLDRMADVGVSLGEIPVNRFFWDTISPMSSPAELVACMSMTFEQANLDYAAYYAKAFETVGDLETFAVLRQVFEDEIKHVRRGVAWFDKWRDPEQDLFEAYCQHLPSPLTASRARGHVFDMSARRRAGLPESFIRKLAIYGASRGRPPSVYWFDPTCEAQAAHGRAHTPKADVLALVADLETLPALQAGTDDVLVVQRMPSEAFLGALCDAGFALPEFQETAFDDPIQLKHEHIGELRPWGWSPKAYRRAGGLFGKCVDGGSESAHHWRPEQRKLYAKTWSAGLLRELSHEEDWPSWWTGPQSVGREAGTIDEALGLCRDILDTGHHRAGIKAPWGTSGRGAIRIDGAELTAGQGGWIERVCRRQGSVLVEPWLERHVDLSIQLHVPRSGAARVVGLTRFETDERGQYLGTHLCNPTWGLSSDLHRWLSNEGKDKRRLRAAVERIAAFVGARLQSEGHVGPAGVDTMICRVEGGWRLKPIVEINPRTTMGHLGLALHNRCARGSVGFWRLLSVRDIRRQGFDSPAGFAARAIERYPLETVVQDGAVRWVRGVVFTNDPERATQVLSMAVVGDAALVGEMRRSLFGDGV